MRAPIAYGIDFGTTNSSISVAWPDEAELVPIAGQDVMPSVLYLDDTRQQLAGNAAFQQYAVAGGANSRLLLGIKSDLADPHLKGTTAPWGQHLSVEDLVAIILRSLKREADRHTGHDVKRVVLGHPVVWVGAEGKDFERRQKLANKRLQEAAHRAGFNEVVLLDEPTAALMAEDPDSATMLAADFGGGTFDVSIIKIDHGCWDVLATQGAAVGGELFNAQLFDLKLAGPLGLEREYVVNGKRLPVPAPLRRIRTLAGALQMAGDTRTRTALSLMYSARESKDLHMVEEIALQGHAVPFHQTVEAAKVQLSTNTQTRISFVRPRVQLDESVTRAEFERCIGSNLRVVRGQIERAIKSAGLTSSDIDLVVRTGGSSQLPAFVSDLEELFGHKKVEARDAFATVALGLGLHAIEHWG